MKPAHVRCGVAAAWSFMAIALLSGCATGSKPLYHWGSYQQQLFEHFRSEQPPQEQIAQLEALRQKAQAQGEALPPGFHAHLGLLHGKQGNDDALVENLSKEKDAFPEATSFIDFLLRRTKK